jgi:hypothetical protein
MLGTRAYDILGHGHTWRGASSHEARGLPDLHSLLNQGSTGPASMLAWPCREACTVRDGVGRLPDLDALQSCRNDHEIDTPITEGRKV